VQTNEQNREVNTAVHSAIEDILLQMHFETMRFARISVLINHPDRTVKASSSISVVVHY